MVLVQTPAPENNEETTAGTTSVKEGKAEPVIYFAAWVGGIMTYSPLKSEVKKIVGGWESCYGIAYDPITEKIYWSTNVERKIYRATTNGSQVETVFNATQCKYLLYFFKNDALFVAFELFIWMTRLQMEAFMGWRSTGQLEIFTSGLTMAT